MQVYPGAIPLDTNILQPQRNVEIALGFMMQAAFGTTTVIDGLAVTQTGTPGMGVLVGPGSIITGTTVDTVASGFGSLTYDGSDALVKIGVNLTSTTMSVLTAPGVAGQSQNWLLEAQFIEADGSPVVLPYYNASNPAVPYTGPLNAGTPNNTARTNRVQLQWKGGTAATTGQQGTPTPDAGWVGVSVITVANGQTSILNANIAPYSAAPLVPTKLPQQRTKLTAALNIYVSPFGSDTAGSGLAASSPFLTTQKAWTFVSQNYDTNGFGVTINLASGTYTAPCSASQGVVGNGTVQFLGNIGSPSSVVVNCATGTACFSASAGALITVSGMTLISSAGVSQLSSVNNAIVGFGNVVFGSAGTGSHITAANGIVIANAAYTISGGAVAHVNASGVGSFVNLAGVAVTISGTPAFSTAFALVQGLAMLSTIGNTFPNAIAATGPRYNGNANSVINTNGAATTLFPGSTAGAVFTGALYV